MAKTYVVKLEIDGVSESVRSINELETAVANLESKIKSADLGSDLFKGLSTELKAAKIELKSFDEEIQSLDPKGQAAKFIQMGSGIAGGFAIATGAAALLGIESEELERTQVKVQGAIAIAVGVRSLAESKLSETIAQSAIAEKARAAATAISTFVTGAATTGLKLFRLALVSTGVGLIVVALGFLAANFDKVKSAVFKLAEYIVNFVIGYFNLYIKAINLVIEGLNKIPGVSIGTISSLESVSFAAEEAANSIDRLNKNMAFSEKIQKSLEKQNKETVKNLERELSLLEAKGASTDAITAKKRELIKAQVEESKEFERGAEMAKSLLNSIRIELAAEIAEGRAEGKTEDQVLSDLGYSTSTEIQDAIDATKQSRLDAENKLNVFNAQIATNRREKNAENSAKQKEIDDAAAAQKLVDDEKALDTDLTRQEAEWQQIQDLTNELALMALESDYERAQEQLIQQEIADLNAINGAENFFEQKLLIEQKYTKLSNDLLKDKLKKEKEIEDEAKAYKEKELKEGIDNLQNILSVGGKNMQKVGKALAIADVVRTSVKSVSQQVSSLGVANAKSVAASPLTGGMPFVAFNTLKAGLSIGSTLASAAKSIQSIKGDSTSVPSSSGAGGGGGGGGGAPNLGTPEETANIDFSFLGDGDVSEVGQTAPVQAYVIGSDVTSSQEASQVIKDQSTL